MSVVVMVMMVRLRGLRSREGRETKGGGSRKSSESLVEIVMMNLVCCACEVAA
jgi:hypothetical protein